MATYRYLILRGRDGEPLGELPASNVQYAEALTGDSSFTCDLPFEHPNARDSLIGPGLGREIAVIRTAAPGSAPACVFNGPITAVRRSFDGGSASTSIAARSPLYYLSRRVTEGPRNYSRPVLAAVDDLIKTAQGIAPRAAKPSGALYRFTSTPLTGGPVKRWSIGGADRTPILDVIDDLADDDVGGFDYRMEYSYVAAGMQVSRLLRLGVPTLGVNLNAAYVLEPGAGLLSFTDEQDTARAANRVWVLGAGTAKGSRRSVAVNTSNLNGSGVLLEQTVERTNVADQNTLNSMARAFRKTLAPPSRVISAEYRAGARLPFQLGELGDTIRVRVVAGGEAIDIRRRIVGRQVSVDDNGEEKIAIVFNDPVDEVVT